jgi:hypothetical protein
MLVRELIEYLKNKDPNDYVGIYDYGQDSGDWVDLDAEEDNIFRFSISVRSKKEIANLYNEGKAEIDNKLLEELINAGEVIV